MFADLSLSFYRDTIIVSLMASVIAGVLGSVVVTRRISSMAGAISHSVLGGIGLALYSQRVLAWSWFHPLLGATIAAILSAYLLHATTRKGRQREDSLVGVIWVVGMAIGLLFLAKTPGYADPMVYLFGNILLVSSADIWRVGILALLLLLFALLGYHRIQSYCFDPEFARIRGLPVDAYNLGLLLLTSLAVVLLINVVGSILVIALLTLPAATACLYARHLWQMMLMATILCAIGSILGLTLSYYQDLPTGPSIILALGGIYLLGILGKSLRSA